MSYKSKSYRKFLATLTTTAVLAAMIAPAANATETKKFSDVDEAYWAANEIYSLVEQGIINGYEDNTYKPEKSIERGQAANLLTAALKLDIPSDLNAFEDVSIDSSFAKGAAATKAAGIFKGYEGKFGVGDVLTREQMASVLVRAFELELDPNGEDVSFTDWDAVSPTHQQNVKILAQHGITTGKADGSFAPKAPVSRAAFAVFLSRALEIQTDENYTLSIMHTNDTHANLKDVAKRATAIKEVRAVKPNALLVDAGDVMTGTLYFNEHKGQADLEFMNLAKYDAMTFGNHEFDQGGSEEGHQALSEFVKGADFPFVSANVDFSKDSLFDDVNQGGTYTDVPDNGNIYSGIIKEVDGEKVGIFGLTTVETPDISSPESIEFKDYIESAEEAVSAFEEQGIDKIVVLSHLGYDDNPAYDNDKLLATYVDGIDVIVGGHSHTELAEPDVVNEDENGQAKEPTVIVQAKEYNKFLGTVDVEFDQDGVVVGYAGELISIADKEEDPEAAAILKEFSEPVLELENTETGAVATEALPNPRLSDSPTSVRNSETKLGNLIADGMLEKARKYNENAVIAFQNGGGIRADIDQGPITLGDILTVLPYYNTLATMNLTGEEILQALEQSVSLAPQENGGFLHVAGMKFTYDSSKPAGERVVSVEVEEEERVFTPLDETKEYVVAINAFTAKGGDNYDLFKAIYAEGRVTDLGIVDWETLRDYVVSLENVDPQIEDRIVDVATSAN